MDRLHLLQDPWKQASERERTRLLLTNEIVRRCAPDCASLLEIGSGEGAQTASLLTVARQVTGVEVSSVAVERARAAVPQAEFLVGRAEDVGRLVDGRRFDLVTACDVLHHAPDVGRVLAVLKGLAPQILVTNSERRARKLAPHFDGPGWTRLDDLVVGRARWRCHLWRAPELERKA
ncbi:MAG: class I SAM-dependent methyltransferase [Sphingobium sp.]|nr:class I SAM-dependent methyltransferase [Sphingobium sp.]